MSELRVVPPADPANSGSDPTADAPEERVWMVVRMTSGTLHAGALLRSTRRSLTLQTACFRDTATGRVHLSRWVRLNEDQIEASWQATAEEACAVTLAGLARPDRAPTGDDRTPWNTDLAEHEQLVARLGDPE